MADGKRAIDAMIQRFGDRVRHGGEHQGQHWCTLDAENLLEIAAWLRDEPEMDYRYLVDVTGAHFPDETPPMEMIYHLYSHKHDDYLRIKLRTGDEGPVPSLSSVWKSADWNERETYDMFGIRFDGHPDLRRILMPDDYTEYPLRKELPLFRG
ncbi:MAG: NADH-quinone oxidoreductase subunit C [Acidobacteriota bacterium]|nr:NADH-quinone oxidoreductase subunit C [Acidobacteriota bacterium]MDH3784557.1 NADH-quinone oxidoreductase subunit C [Acidobacteriota bacterium]